MAVDFIRASVSVTTAARLPRPRGIAGIDRGEALDDGDPRNAVAWGPPNASRAKAVEGGYRVTGQWDFCSGCRQSRWIGAHCAVVEAISDRRLKVLSGPQRGVSAAWNAGFNTRSSGG